MVTIKLNETAAQSMALGKSGGVATTGLASLDQLNARYQAVQMERIFRLAGKHEAKHRQYGLHRWYRVKFSAAMDPEAVAAAYALDPNVEKASPVYQKEMHGRFVRGALPGEPAALLDTFVPNDPRYAEQWHYNNTGQVEGSTPDADINLPEAHALTTGSSDVIVQVVDSGIDLSHPDIIDNLWVNPGEIPDNGIDDDNNGYVDDVYGYNFADDTNDPSIVNPADVTNSHGMHTSGTIAARSNNGIGVAGVAGGDGSAGSGVRIMTAVTFGANVDGFAEAIVYGADNGAVISSNSWGYTLPGVFEPAVLDAIDYFVAEAGQFPGAPIVGGLFINSAGNSNSDLDYYPGFYPASVAVAATDFGDRRASYSNYGDWVDIAAPGGDIPPVGSIEEYVTHPAGVLSLLHSSQFGGYGFFDGTSMAAPHVSGVAALVASYMPGMTAAEVRALLELSGRDVSALNPGFHIGKRVDAFNALQGPDEIPPAPVTDLAIVAEMASTIGTSVTLTWTAVGDDGTDGTAARYDLRYSTAGPIDASNFDDATPVTGLPAPQPAGSTETFTATGLPFNTEMWFALVVEDEFGNRSDVSNSPSTVTDAGPQYSFTPEEVEVELLVGESTTETVTLANNGDTDLTFSFLGFASLSLTQAPGATLNDTSAPVADATHAKGNDAFGGVGHPVLMGAGGPDGFGYNWIDSNEPGGPVYDWLDISGVGDPLSLTDESTASVSLPFAFSFYGTEYTSVNVVSNGYLTFNAGGSDFSNDPIPSTATPNNLIAPFWDDLNPGAGGTVHTYYDAANERFIVQFTDVPHYISSNGTYTFQAILYRNGTLLFQYEELGNVTSATVGVENATGEDGLQVVFNAPYLTEELAVAIQYAPPYLSLSPSAGTVPAGGSVALNVGFDAGDLETGIYTFPLEALITQSGSTALATLPTTLNVTGEPFPFVVSPETIEASLATDEQTTRTLRIENPTEEAQSFHLEVRGAAGTAPAFVPLLQNREDWMARQARAAAGEYPRGSAAPSAGLPPASATTGTAPVNLTSALGVMAYSTSVFGDQSGSFVSFDLGVPDVLTELGASPLAFAGDFAFGQQDRFLVITTDNLFHSVSTTDGSITTLGVAQPATTSETWTELASDPTTGTLYGSTYSSATATSYLYTLNPTTGEATLVAPISGAQLIIAIAISANGQMWGHEIVNDVLVKINKNTGVATTVGPTGFDANYAQGMDFDLTTGRLYLAAYNNALSRGELRIADTSTGLTTLVGTLGSGDELGYLALGSVGFVRPNLIAGTLPAGQHVDIQLLLDATGLFEGTYDASVAVVASVAGDPEQVVPVSLTVDADPDVAVNPEALDFGELFVNASATQNFLLINEGRAALTVNLSVDHPAYTLGSETDLVLFAGESRVIPVTFTPTEVGEAGATITITSDDPDEPTVEVALTGTGIPAPVLELTPSAFNTQAYPGLTYTQTLTITNAGGNPLTFVGAETNVVTPGATFGGSPFFSENFDAGIPGTWTVVDNEGTGITWATSADWGEGNYTGGQNLAAMVCSDCAGPGEYDTELRTPELTAPTNNVVLTYRANYQNFANLDFLDVDISTDGGTSWTTVLSWNEDHGGFFGTPGENVTIDLSPYVSAGETFIVRWHAYNPNSGDWDWYSQIDDVAFLSLYEWFTFDPQQGEVQPGESLDLTLSFNATGLVPGVYRLDLLFSTNDPVQPTAVVPVTYTVVEGLSVATPDAEVHPNEVFELPLSVNSVDFLGVESYEFQISFDPALLEVQDVLTEGTLSEGASLAVNTTVPGQLIVAAFAPVGTEGTTDPVLFSFQGEGTLVRLQFRAKEALGDAGLTLDHILFNEGAPAGSGTLGTVTVVPLYGDASLNLEISSFDAALTLQHVAGLVSLNEAAQVAADVTGNGDVSAFDASWIARYVVGVVDEFPVTASGKGAAAVAANLAWGDLTQDPRTGHTLLPLRLEEAAGPVTALEVVAPFDADVIALEQVEAQLPEGWQMAHHVDEAGRLHLAMAGASALPVGEVATLVLRWQNPVATASINLSASSRINEEAWQQLAADLSLPPETFDLAQNYPNPFSTSTTFRYQLPETASVRLTIYNVLGQVVRVLVEEEQKAGRYEVVWDGRDRTGARVASGMYFYRFEAGSYTQTRRMMRVK
ncbi:S8 family serine peptidase [Rhodocaloribacter litoris]|uniref:S8 family serine peptidase n=1 Tax=Rhodocaloribacter litoris TaxID=2558931 RepID=UPI00142214D4|nr:S8 family serine peptidase [Rhodocaloribacter litoris]QXD14069.1 S8 family serine peptidase [Rhodocaloribacter litoris]